MAFPAGAQHLLQKALPDEAAQFIAELFSVQGVAPSKFLSRLCVRLLQFILCERGLAGVGTLRPVDHRPAHVTVTDFGRFVGDGQLQSPVALVRDVECLERCIPRVQPPSDCVQQSPSQSRCLCIRQVAPLSLGLSVFGGGMAVRSPFIIAPRALRFSKVVSITVCRRIRYALSQVVCAILLRLLLQFLRRVHPVGQQPLLHLLAFEVGALPAGGFVVRDSAQVYQSVDVVFAHPCELGHVVHRQDDFGVAHGLGLLSDFFH